MKLPFIKYLEALVFTRASNEEIVHKLQEMPIPLAKNFPSAAIIEVRRKLSSKDPDYLKKPFTADYPNIDLLHELKLYDLVYYLLKLDAGYSLSFVRGAFELLYDLDMFQKMSSLAFANVTEQDIELIVQGKYNIHYDELQIKTFFDLFFDVKDWTLGEKKEYLKHVKDPDLRDFYEMALDGDKSYLMWKLGIAPEKSFEAMLSDVTSDTYYFFKEKAKYSPSEAQSWASLFLRTIERAEKLQSDKDKSADFFTDLNSLIEEAKERSDEISSNIQQTEEAPLPHINTLNDEK